MKTWIHFFIYAFIAKASVPRFPGVTFHDKEFRVGKEKIIFSSSSDCRIIIEKRCIEQNCLASEALNRASWKRIKKEISGGANPGALICLKLSGKVVFGLDHKDNQNSFCKFADSSLVDNGTLASYGLKNDH